MCVTEYGYDSNVEKIEIMNEYLEDLNFIMVHSWLHQHSLLVRWRIVTIQAQDSSQGWSITIYTSTLINAHAGQRKVFKFCSHFLFRLRHLCLYLERSSREGEREAPTTPSVSSFAFRFSVLYSEFPFFPRIQFFQCLLHFKNLAN